MIIFFIKSNNSSIFLSLFSIIITPFTKDVIILIMIRKQNKLQKNIERGGVRCTERVGDIKIIAEKEKNEKTIF